MTIKDKLHLKQFYNKLAAMPLEASRVTRRKGGRGKLSLNFQFFWFLEGYGSKAIFLGRMVVPSSKIEYPCFYIIVKFYLTFLFYILKNLSPYLIISWYSLTLLYNFLNFWLGSIEFILM